MKQTIYCSTFYCSHYKDGKCLAPILHLSSSSACREFIPSEAKLNARLDAASPDRPEEYGEYDTPNTAIRIRQK